MNHPPLLQVADFSLREGDLLVQVSPFEDYLAEHIPGALCLPSESLFYAQEPALGLLPPVAALAKIFSALGLTEDKHVIAYDGGANMHASRLLWTLDVLGHHRWSLLNGGLTAWKEAGKETTTELPLVEKTDYQPHLDPAPTASAEDILAHLKNNDVTLWDTRTTGEYNGTTQKAARNGHIPGAVHWDVQNLKQPDHPHLLKDPELIASELRARGITGERPVIAYCHSHNRSSLCYVAGKLAGLKNIQGYPGSWSEWGNREDTPIET